MIISQAIEKNLGKLDQEYEAFCSEYKNDVKLAYHWSIKMYTGMSLVF